jgi:hypothetical protein
MSSRRLVRKKTQPSRLAPATGDPEKRMVYWIIQSIRGFRLVDWNNDGPVWGLGLPMRFGSLEDVRRTQKTLIGSIHRIVKVIEEEEAQ